MQPVTTAILSSRIPEWLMPRLRRQTDKASLAQRWIDLGLAAGVDDGGLQLLTNDSWFAGNMIEEYASLYPEHTAQR